MKCLVTGGAGFIGSNLALELEKQGHKVIVADNLSTGTKQNLKDFKGKFLKIDISKPSKIRDFCGSKNSKNFLEPFQINEKLEVIFHQAAITDPRFGDDEKMERSNIEGFKNMIELAKKNNAKLIYASSASLYGNGPIPMKEDQKKEPLSAYASSKLDMDNMTLILKNGINIVGLRYFNVFGPREQHKGRPASMIYHLTKQIKNNKNPRLFKNGEQKRDHIYIKDAVNATIKAIDAPSGIYNVGTGIATSFNELVKILNEVLKKTNKIEYFDMPYKKETYQENTQAETTLAEEKLKFKAQWTLKKAIEDYVKLLKSKVVLVYPPMVFGKKRGFGFPPLGILYIATFLKKKGFEVKVIDGFIEGYTLEELIKEILKEKPDIAGFSAMTCQVNAVLDIAKALKKKNPFLKIAVGGSHIGSTREELFKFTKDIDFLFYGEGENTFYKLINALEKDLPLENIDGLIYKKNGRIIVNKPPQLIKNLDELPFPDLSLVDIKKYDSYYAKSLPLTAIMASRGCPFNCTFCDAYATHGKILRLRSPKNIVNEIEYNHKKFNIKQFMVKDSTLTVNKKWVHKMCSEIKKRGLKINWTCNTRVDRVNEELLKDMKDCGCHLIMFGIESGSQKVLNTLKKGISIEQIKKGISLCRKVGIETAGYFMIGNPGETEEDANNTLKLAKELKLDLATFGVTTAYPGTDIYMWALENDALPDRFWYMKKNMKIAGIREADGNLNLKSLPKKKQAELVKKANREFYFRPSIILKQIMKLRRTDDLKRAIKSLKELFNI